MRENKEGFSQSQYIDGCLGRIRTA